MKRLISCMMFAILLLGAGIMAGCRNGGYGNYPDESGLAGLGKGSGVISGTVTASGTLRTSLRPNNTSGSAVGIASAVVWLQDHPEITVTTDASGAYVLSGVPHGSGHRVVARFQLRDSSGRLVTYKVRSSNVTVDSSTPARADTNLELLYAENTVSGVLTDIQGNPLRFVNLVVWGETFQTDGNGRFDAPPLPGEITLETITVNAPGFTSSPIAVVFSASGTAFVEFSIRRPGETNSPPRVLLLRDPRGGSVLPGAMTTLWALFFDPDGETADLGPVSWAAAHGVLASSTAALPASLQAAADLFSSELSASGNQSAKIGVESCSWTAPSGNDFYSVTAQVRDKGGLSGRATCRVPVGSPQSPPVNEPAPRFTTCSFVADTATSQRFSFVASKQVKWTLEIGIGSPIQIVASSGVSYQLSASNLHIRGLAAATTYAYKLTGTDQKGLQVTSTGTFTTPDLLPPTVVSVIPAENATGIAPTSKITIIFSKPMDGTTLTSANIKLASGATAISGAISVSADKKVATFTPDVLLPEFSVITVTVTTGVKDLDGKAMTAQKQWAFTVPDSTPATVASVLPAEDAFEISANSKVTITFSEPMNGTTLTTANIKLASGAIAIAGTISVSADQKVATFTPDVSFADGSLITVTVTTGASDVGGNPMAASKKWSFTVTDPNPPVIVSVIPADGATGIDPTTKITVTFSKPMDVTTLTDNVFVINSYWVRYPGTVTVSSDGRVATFTPSMILAEKDRSTGKVHLVRDAGGRSMAYDMQWSFTTADATPPTIASVAPANDATQIMRNGRVALTFSEPMDETTLTTANIKLSSGTTQIAGTISVSTDKKSALFTPAASFTAASVITVTVEKGAKDISGLPLVESHSSRFTVMRSGPKGTIGYTLASQRIWSSQDGTYGSPDIPGFTFDFKWVANSPHSSSGWVFSLKDGKIGMSASDLNSLPFNTGNVEMGFGTNYLSYGPGTPPRGKLASFYIYNDSGVSQTYTVTGYAGQFELQNMMGRENWLYRSGTLLHTSEHAVAPGVWTKIQLAGCEGVAEVKIIVSSAHSYFTNDFEIEGEW